MKPIRYVSATFSGHSLPDLGCFRHRAKMSFEESSPGSFYIQTHSLKAALEVREKHAMVAAPVEDTVTAQLLRADCISAFIVACAFVGLLVIQEWHIAGAVAFIGLATVLWRREQHELYTGAYSSQLLRDWRKSFNQHTLKKRPTSIEISGCQWRYMYTWGVHETLKTEGRPIEPAHQERVQTLMESLCN